MLGVGSSGTNATTDLPRSRQPAGELPAIVDRIAERDLVQRIVAGLPTDGCHAVQLFGEPGIGKSALIRAALGGDHRIIWCEGDPIGQRRPFGLLLEGLAIDRWRRTAHEVILAPFNSEHLLAERLLTEIGRILADGPMVLVLDNVHWADDSTIDLLPRLTREYAAQPLLLVTAGDSQLAAETWRVSSTLSRSCPTTELRLRPLTLKESWSMVTRLLGWEPARDAEPLVASAGGNPYLLTRVADALEAARRAGSVEPPALTLPMSQLPHLARLSTDCVRFLELAAVLGQGFDSRQLSKVSGQPLAQVIELVREATAAGVLEDNLGALRFRHELIRSTLAGELPDTVRSDLHRFVAGELASSGADPVDVVDHLVEATLAPLDFDWVHSVAVKCTTAAPARALELWDHLIDGAGLTDPLDPRLAEVESHRAVAQFSLGHLGEAEATARKVLDAGTAHDESELRACLTMSLLIQGRPEEARELAEIGDVSTDLHPWERAEQTALAGMAALLSGDPAAAEVALRRAERDALATGSMTALIRVLVTRGYDAHCRADLGTASLLLQEAAKLTEIEGITAAQGTFAHAMLGLVLSDLDRVDDAQGVFSSGRRLARSRGLDLVENLIHSARASAAVSVGVLDDAAEALDAELRRFAQDDAWWHPLQLSRRGIVALYRDGPESAEGWLRQIRQVDEPEQGYGMAWRARAVAAVRTARGDVEGALNELWRAWDEVTAAGIMIDRRVLAADLTQAALATGDEEKAGAALAGIEEIASGNPDVASLEVSRLMVRGLVTGEVDALVAATVAAARSPRLLGSAKAAEEAAIALARSGNAQKAHQLSRDAMAYYARAGAGFEAARARAALRRVGIRVREPARTRPRTGWEALTPAEQVVARYVEQGLSNSDIADELVLSRRTVETHVSHILAKLQLRSRADLILAAARTGRIPSQGGSPDVETD